MIVVGGSYTEHCVDPSRVRLLGSGLRAACINRNRLDQFVTSLHPSEFDQAAAALAVAPDRLVATERSQSIRFVYETPISKPSIDIETLALPVINAEADQAMVFGMVDARPIVRAGRAVVDPQSSLSLAAIDNDVHADEKVIVANSREMKWLAGRTSLAGAMQAVLDATGAAGVVAKCGVSGCAVLSPGAEPLAIGACPTEAVWPIGSGDAFSAGFAAHFFDHGELPAAAEAGVLAAAAVCSTDQLSLRPVSPLLDLGPPSVAALENGPRVYVAASFTSTHQRWLLRHVVRAMRDVGIVPFSPLHENGLYEGDAKTIASLDLKGIDACDSVLLLADGSRTGPWVEAGWATRHGLPVVIFTEDDARDRYTMLVGSGAQVVGDLASAIYRAGWLGIAARHLK